jgi:hypothetical protein
LFDYLSMRAMLAHMPSSAETPYPAETIVITVIGPMLPNRALHLVIGQAEPVEYALKQQ